MTRAAQRPDRDRPRHLAHTTLRSALERARRDGRLLAVLLVDAGDVGRVDRACGHAAGDDALAALELRLHDALPPACALTRLTRERIVVVAERLAAHAEAFELAATLARCARAPLGVADVGVRLDATVGLALAVDGNGTADALLRDADAAARQAHRAGEAPWRLADPAEHERALRRLRLEDELADAVARDQLVLYFQPIVSLRRGTLAGVEALVRWQHPERGLIGPAQFLPVAEESGLIVEIGDWMLQAVCRQLERWAAQPQRTLPPVALNVSGRELLEQAFASRFASTLLAAQVPPGVLALEISDSAALHERGDAQERLEALRRLGVRIVLDRFGGDRSTLSQLAQLPVDGLKLDPALLSPRGAAARELAIAEAVVGLAHALGLPITVPGIETEQELETVRALHADAAQGHLLARPAPAAELLDVHALERGVGARRRAGEGASEDPQELLPLSAVAEALGVSSSTARRLADQGVLPGTRTEGGHRRFRRSDVQRLARERSRAPGLRRWELPTQPLPLSAQLLGHDGPALLARSARAIYEPTRPGWFAAPQGVARSRAWLAALGEALAAGSARDALAATTAYGDAAMLGGASVVEVVRFLGQFGALASHELLRAHAAAEEGRALQRVIAAATEELLAKL